MRVHKSQSRRAVVIAGWIIHDDVSSGAARIVRVHVYRKPPVIDAVFAFNDEKPRLGRGWPHDVTQFLELPVPTRVRPAAITNVSIHRNASHTFRPPTPRPSSGMVCRTLVNAGIDRVAAE